MAQQVNAQIQSCHTIWVAGYCACCQGDLADHRGTEGQWAGAGDLALTTVSHGSCMAQITRGHMEARLLHLGSCRAPYLCHLAQPAGPHAGPSSWPSVPRKTIVPSHNCVYRILDDSGGKIPSAPAHSRCLVNGVIRTYHFACNCCDLAPSSKVTGFLPILCMRKPRLREVG